MGRGARESKDLVLAFFLFQKNDNALCNKTGGIIIIISVKKIFIIDI